jgi:tryptophan-rich sensory protein
MSSPSRGTFWNLVGLLAVCYGVAALGGWSTSQGVREWYPALAKPPHTPPSWVFGPVWTILYGLLAVSLWRVWRAPGARTAKALFWALLLTNAAWSHLFFGLRRPDLALVDILLYLTLLAGMVRELAKLDRTAAWLQAPHLAWVAYASTINAGVWWLNR